jgi:RNA polymerase sigma-70 factor (ECF subfamily)
LERASRRDAGALAEIYDLYASCIYRYLYRYLGDAHVAEDLTSEVFLRLLQVLGTRRAPSRHLRGWLYRVAHNLAMDWYRRSAKETGIELDESLESDSPPVEETVADLVYRDHLRKAIGQLTANQQRVILLRFGEGFKITEVSHIMGKSPGAVKVLQHRAIRRLQTLLRPRES